jgi:transposase-like protein
MNLIDVAQSLQTEDQCLDFLERRRWPNGVRCLRCGNDKLSRITRTVDETKNRREKKQNKRTRLYACLEPTCQYRFTPTVGTIFADSHLPLTKWFAAVALIVHAKKGMSAMQMQRHLAVSYRTAWYMGHRIRKSMADANGSTGGPKLSGTVEIDETYVGGVKRGRGGVKKDKAVVMGIRERGGDLRLFQIAAPSIDELSKKIKENVSQKVKQVITDEWAAYPGAFIASGIHGRQHETIRHKDRVYVQGNVHTNTVESAFSLLKRGIVGSFHQISRKHLHRYLSEFEYRFNRRELPDLFSATVARMVSTKEMKYAELISETTRTAWVRGPRRKS